MTFTSELELSQALVRVASPSCQEADVMTLACEAFTSLGFDDSYLDEAGNAVGVYKRGEGPTIMLNGHLDTVPVGDESLWPHPPLSGTVVDGNLWGRGSVDMKSAVACMAFAAQDAVAAGFNGTVQVTGVVQEEIGGLGARHLSNSMNADVVILGEPSNLNLMLGHRGRVEVEVTFPGKIAHAAKNELGDNALYRAADFLHQVKLLELPTGGPLGGSTLTPSWLESYPRASANVVPGGAKLKIDYRNIPGDEPEDVVARLKTLAPDATFVVKELHAESQNARVKLKYSNAVPGYLCPGENRYVTAARQSVKAVLADTEVPYQERVWWFATDAPHLATMGAPVIGFGPGNEDLAHTTNERVPVRQLAIARRVYRALLLDYAAQFHS